VYNSVTHVPEHLLPISPVCTIFDVRGTKAGFPPDKGGSRGFFKPTKDNICNPLSPPSYGSSMSRGRRHVSP
jgi:hypothetical protein